MPFKYYAYTNEGLDGWMELSVRVQRKLEYCDAYAKRHTTGAMNGFMFRIGVLRHAARRRANYEVRAGLDQVVHIRLIRFNDGEVVEVRCVQEPPPFHEIGFHTPARV
jgi:hypothetical protein